MILIGIVVRWGFCLVAVFKTAIGPVLEGFLSYLRRELTQSGYTVDSWYFGVAFGLRPSVLPPSASSLC